MAKSQTLQDAFLDELRDAYDAERQLVKALPKLAKAATSEELRDAFTMHLEETRAHVDRLTQVFESLEERPRGKHCAGMAGIVEEGSEVTDEDFDDETMDACLIASGQRAEHYEMAAYGTLIAWARVLGHDDAVELLQQNLDEEKNADEKLTSLAESGINQSAADAGSMDSDDDDSESDDEESEDMASPASSATSRSTSAGGARASAAKRRK
jgi:ferritin-like metal-binding protein YciE